MSATPAGRAAGGRAVLLGASVVAGAVVCAGQVHLEENGEGLVYYWPQKVQKEALPPLAVRLWRLRGERGDIWLITNVLDEQRLPRQTAGKFYWWRWRNEGLFRTYKRTLGKVKLMSRTVVQVHREAEGSLLATQLLLGPGRPGRSRPRPVARSCPPVPARSCSRSAPKSAMSPGCTWDRGKQQHMPTAWRQAHWHAAPAT